MEKNHAKSFVLQMGSLIALYIAISSLLVLLFSIINLRLPDSATSVYELESAREAIRNTIAILIVVFPAYLLLTRASNQNRREDPLGEYTVIGKWLVYLSLLVAGGALLGDLVVLIQYFLNGEITSRFLLKVFTFFGVITCAFSYYLYDVKGYFVKNEQKAIQIGLISAVFVSLSLVIGFTMIETPGEVREMKIDDQQVTDLQQIQFMVEEYYTLNNSLPDDLSDLTNNINESTYSDFIPKAPEGREPYQYVKIADDRYQLCATFVAASNDEELVTDIYSPLRKASYSWNHGEGEWCFERVISLNKEYEEQI